jgi:hypothetical protein
MYPSGPKTGSEKGASQAAMGPQMGEQNLPHRRNEGEEMGGGGFRVYKTSVHRVSRGPEQSQQDVVQPRQEFPVLPGEGAITPQETQHLGATFGGRAHPQTSS